MASIIVDASFRAKVHAAADRVGVVRIVAPPAWMAFVDRLLLGQRISADVDAVPLVVGPPATVLRHAAEHTTDFAFVMPVAQMTRPWQRMPSWRDDATIDLWHAGWSPLAIDRLLVARNEATVEFVIGNARRTPIGDDVSSR